MMTFIVVVAWVVVAVPQMMKYYNNEDSCRHNKLFLSYVVCAVHECFACLGLCVSILVVIFQIINLQVF